MPDLNEPAEDFSTFLHVLHTGGCEITRPVAIAWLDSYEIKQTSLSESEARSVLTMLSEGGHPDWEAGYRQHLFNSAFNALHRSRIGEAFTRCLLHLSQHDADRTMRLYALQHLHSQRRIGHLPDGPLASEVHAAIQSMANAANGDEAGYAIQILATWQGSDETISDPKLLALALSTAADSSRPVDIRVTAMHAAGSASLPLARTLARKSAEHVMLRKAAIARIGHHGTAEDFPSLEALRDESSRLAQAAEPALIAIRDRIAHHDKPQPHPY